MTCKLPPAGWRSCLDGNMAVGRPMEGWILVERAGIETEAELNAWVRQGVEFARGLPAKR